MSTMNQTLENGRRVLTRSDLYPSDLKYRFQGTKQGLRFTVSENARSGFLDRLLELNHKRYAEEVAQGLHDKKKGKGKKRKTTKKTTAKKADTNDMFGEVE